MEKKKKFYLYYKIDKYAHIVDVTDRLNNELAQNNFIKTLIAKDIEDAKRRASKYVDKINQDLMIRNRCMEKIVHNWLEYDRDVSFSDFIVGRRLRCFG